MPSIIGRRLLASKPPASSRWELMTVVTTPSQRSQLAFAICRSHASKRSMEAQQGQVGVSGAHRIKIDVCDLETICKFVEGAALATEVLEDRARRAAVGMAHIRREVRARQHEVQVVPGPRRRVARRQAVARGAGGGALLHV